MGDGGCFRVLIVVLCLGCMDQTITTEELLKAEIRFKDTELRLKDAQLNALVKELLHAGVLSEETASRILKMEW